MAIAVHRPTDWELAEVVGVANAPEDATKNSNWQVLSEGKPYVHIARVEPGSHIPSHSHSTEEVMVVLQGSLGVDDGAQCEPGSIVIIPPDETYALNVGDEGVTFAVVRPNKAAFRDKRATA